MHNLSILPTWSTFQYKQTSLTKGGGRWGEGGNKMTAENEEN